MTAAVFFSAPVLCSPHHTFLRHQLHLTSLPAILYPAASADSWRGVGILTDRRSAPSHPPRQSLIFEEPNPPEGLQNSSLFYYSRALRIRVLEVCSGVGEVADVHLLPWITSSTWGSENNPNTKRNVGKEINNQVHSAF